jgi:pilus assembly protein Flp/PilA
MLKFYVRSTEALKRLRSDSKGVVSFEYVIVAACIVTAVVAAFGIDANGNIATKLKDSITAILGKITIT